MSGSSRPTSRYAVIRTPGIVWQFTPTLASIRSGSLGPEVLQSTWDYSCSDTEVGTSAWTHYDTGKGSMKANSPNVTGNVDILCVDGRKKESLGT
jgi:hypothetical protein